MNSNKKEKKNLSISIDPEINDMLESKSINKSKLINTLLREYFINLEKSKK